MEPPTDSDAGGSLPFCVGSWESPNRFGAEGQEDLFIDTNQLMGVEIDAEEENAARPAAKHLRCFAVPTAQRMGEASSHL